MRKTCSTRALYLQNVLFLLLVVSGHCWAIKGKKSGGYKDAPAERKTKSKTVLPPTTFVRIFALPSEEAKLAQHRVGELLSMSCKNYARSGGCNMFSATAKNGHIRVLEFSEGDQKSIIAYMLQESNADIEKALDACEERQDRDDTAAKENGKDYRCYMEKAVNIPTRQQVLTDLKGKMEEMGVYKQLSAAPHKSIFLTADPRLIVYEECHRLVKDNNDYDFFLQTVRNSFRRVVEWLAWQHQEIAVLTQNTPMLYTHAEELDNNEQAEIDRVMEFLEIPGNHHVTEKVVTAKDLAVSSSKKFSAIYITEGLNSDDLNLASTQLIIQKGELKFQKERLRAALQILPGTLLADIEEFLGETLQDIRLVERYAGNSTSSRNSWPPPTMLQALAIDNTILVTAATCSYARLIINWIKHVDDIGIPCYLVIALDDELYDFLHNWKPAHVVRAPPGFIPVVPRQYAAKGTGAMTHLSRVRIAALRAITNQGYNVAWADSDLAFVRNVFTVMSRWFDFEATWTGGKGDPLGIYEKTTGYVMKFPDADRQISPSFLYFRGSDAARAFIGKWHATANESTAEEDGVVLNRLLKDPEINRPLNIEMQPESLFPSGAVTFKNASSSYKKAWETQPAAYAHPDTAKTLEEKIDLLASNNFWKVVPEDPNPTCQKATEDYLEDGTVVQMWPPPELLQKIAIDNTVLITSSTCAYSDLTINWIKHVWDLNIGCFLVAAADKATHSFLHDWLPEHTTLIPDGLHSKVSQFVEEGTAAHTKLVISQPVILKKVLEQGYNAAWSDADVAWTRNPFIMFDKTPDVVLAWADNSNVSAGEIFQHGEFSGSRHNRKIGISFIFLRPGSQTIALMDAWAGKLNVSSSIDEAAALETLLASKAFQNLTIGFFPSAAFPTAAEITTSTPAALKEAWTKEDNKPAWLHADSGKKHAEKVQLFKNQSQWKLGTDEPLPNCKNAGRLLGDLHDDSQSVYFQPAHQHRKSSDRSK